jgi:hypothetical protein
MEERADDGSDQEACEGKKTNQQPDLLQGEMQLVLKIRLKLEEDSDIAEIEENDDVQRKELPRQDPVGPRHEPAPLSNDETENKVTGNLAPVT